MDGLDEASGRKPSPRKGRRRHGLAAWGALALLLGGLADAACSGRNEPPVNLGNKAPLAAAGPDIEGQAGTALLFDGSGSSDLDGKIISYLWNFGDGQEAAGEKASHAFTSGGSFIVTLTVSDDHDTTGSDQAVVKIAEPLPVPAASFPSPVHVGDAVPFDASASTAASTIRAWRWSFGDGQNASGETASHNYDRAGSFTVRLAVDDIDQRSAEGSWPIEVFPLDIDGIYDLNVTPQSFGCAAYSATFPDSVLTLRVLDAAGSVTGVSGSHNWSGTLTGPDLHLTSSYIAPTGGGCINAPVTASLNLGVSAPGTLSGDAALFYDLSVGCQCSAAFTLSATRR